MQQIIKGKEVKAHLHTGTFWCLKFLHAQMYKWGYLCTMLARFLSEVLERLLAMKAPVCLRRWTRQGSWTVHDCSELQSCHQHCDYLDQLPIRTHLQTAGMLCENFAHILPECDYKANKHNVLLFVTGNRIDSWYCIKWRDEWESTFS